MVERHKITTLGVSPTLIRAGYLGADPGDTSSLVNPEAVDEIILAR